MVETVYITPTGAKLLRNGYGMLFSSNMDEIKKYLTEETASADYFEAMFANDLLDEIDYQTTLRPVIKKVQINGIIPNGTHFLSGLDSKGHFIIDGKTYICDLDPNDGDGRISSSLEKCNNMFDPIKVYIQWEKYIYTPNDKDDENCCDVYMTIIHDGKTIAKLGTQQYEVREWAPIFDIDESLSLD